jgi:hypothetical protein
MVHGMIQLGVTVQVPLSTSNIPSKARFLLTPLHLFLILLQLGTSLYIYGIIIDIVATTYLFTTNDNLTLTVDSQNYTFQHQPLNTNSYEYNYNVFAVHNLDDTSHAMQVSLNPNSVFLVRPSSRLPFIC